MKDIKKMYNYWDLLLTSPDFLNLVPSIFGLKYYNIILHTIKVLFKIDSKVNN